MINIERASGAPGLANTCKTTCTPSCRACSPIRVYNSRPRIERTWPRGRLKRWLSTFVSGPGHYLSRWRRHAKARHARFTGASCLRAPTPSLLTPADRKKVMKQKFLNLEGEDICRGFVSAVSVLHSRLLPVLCGVSFCYAACKRVEKNRLCVLVCVSVSFSQGRVRSAIIFERRFHPWKEAFSDLREGHLEVTPAIIVAAWNENIPWTKSKCTEHTHNLTRRKQEVASNQKQKAELFVVDFYATEMKRANGPRNERTRDREMGSESTSHGQFVFQRHVMNFDLLRDCFVSLPNFPPNLENVRALLMCIPLWLCSLQRLVCTLTSVVTQNQNGEEKNVQVCCCKVSYFFVFKVWKSVPFQSKAPKATNDVSFIPFCRFFTG